jgi:hypothetical protein
MTITGERFQSLVKQAFNPFLIELGFKPQKPHLSGRYHRVNFIGDSHTLIISFEPGDAYLTAMLVKNDDYDLSSIDDPKKTPRMSDLNRIHMGKITPSERANNESFFSTIKVKDQNEQALLKLAKNLRLVLPRYLKTLNTSQI